MQFLLYFDRLPTCFRAMGLKDSYQNPQSGFSGLQKVLFLQRTCTRICHPPQLTSKPVLQCHVTPLRGSCGFEKTAVLSPSKSVRSMKITNNHHRQAIAKNSSSPQSKRHIKPGLTQDYLHVLSGSLPMAGKTTHSTPKTTKQSSNVPAWCVLYYCTSGSPLTAEGYHQEIPARSYRA